jgi:hypothetical protein
LPFINLSHRFSSSEASQIFGEMRRQETTVKKLERLAFNSDVATVSKKMNSDMFLGLLALMQIGLMAAFAFVMKAKVPRLHILWSAAIGFIPALLVVAVFAVFLLFEIGSHSAGEMQFLNPRL